MELFEPILHFFEQRWVHNIIWAVILAIGTAVAAKVASKTLRHLLNRDDNPLPASSIFINIARAVIWMIGGSFIQDITWRHTTIKDACGQTIIVPNSSISKNTLVHLMPFGRVAVPVAVKDPSKWASLDALAGELASATKTAVLPISGFDKEPYVLFSEIGDFGIKGKIIFTQPAK